MIIIHMASTDPVAAVSERSAIGETKVIFDDIKATLGVPVVNLIFRHIATVPGALPWMWELLRPLYLSAELRSAASSLIVAMRLPSVPTLSRSALQVAGVDAENELLIARVLDTYNRSNALNLIALAALSAASNTETRLIGAPQSGRDPDEPQTAKMSGSEARRLPAPIEEALPALLALADMDRATRELVESLNRIGDRDGGRILASMYCQLAHWPGYLALAETLLKSLEAAGALANAIEETRAAGRREAFNLAERVHATPVSAPAPGMPERQAVDEALERFTSNTIAKMLTIAQVLKASLPP